MSRPPLTPELIVAAAAEIVDSSGFSPLTLSAVARHLGVQAPSLYSHVRDLNALRDGVTILALGELSDLVAESVAGRAGKDALRAFADAHKTYATTKPGRWQSLQHKAGTAVVESAAARRIVTLANAVLRGYDLSPVALVHGIRLIGSTINGFLNLDAVGNFDHSSPPSEKSWSVIIDALDTLLTHWPHSPAQPESNEISQ